MDHGKKSIQYPKSARLSILILVIAASGSLYVVWHFYLNLIRENARSASCQSNLRQLAVDFQMYCDDYGDTYPPNTKSVGWVDSTMTRTKNVSLYWCPDEYHGQWVRLGRFEVILGYWYNSNLSGYRKADIRESESTYLLGDGNDGTEKITTSYSLSSFPPHWLIDRSMPPYRHNGGANYLFVDGHIKWLRPKELGRYTFEAR